MLQQMEFEFAKARLADEPQWNEVVINLGEFCVASLAAGNFGQGEASR